MRGSVHPMVWFGLAVSMIGGLVTYSIYESKQWDAFAATHECKTVGKIAGYWSYGYYNGKYQYHWTRDKTVYKCNDGVEYTR